MNIKLSDHFHLYEAERSNIAIKENINNICPEDLYPSLRAVAEKILEPIRNYFKIPFSPTSWYRSEELNSRVGGSKTSKHLLGEAVDIVLPGVSSYDIAKFISNNLIFDQLILEHYNPEHRGSGWVHASYSILDNRGQVLRADKNKDGKTEYKGIVL